jgi:hypothetical protein
MLCVRVRVRVLVSAYVNVWMCERLASVREFTFSLSRIYHVYKKPSPTQLRLKGDKSQTFLGIQSNRKGGHCVVLIVTEYVSRVPTVGLVYSPLHFFKL